MSDPHAPAPDEATTARQVTVHEHVGGDAFFVELVDRFYAGVAGDARLRPMYPDDLTDSRAHLAGFLIQYWGGSQAYSEERGHPRLRMRHFPFAIGNTEAVAWYGHMAAAVHAMAPEATARTLLLEYFERAAHAMINVAS